MTQKELIALYLAFDPATNLESDYLHFEEQYQALSHEEKISLLNSLDAKNTDFNLLRGLLLKSVGKFDEAISVLTAEIQTNSSDWRAYIGLAFTLYLTKDSQKIALAEKVLTLCSTLHPNLETPHALLESFTNECAFHGDPFYQKIVSTLLETYKATSFVETGTYLGHSSEFIAKRFPKLPVYTTEVNQGFFDIATNRLKKYDSVSMYKQHTLDFLRQTLINIDLGERPVFFIDAHWEHDWPLIDELNHIKTHYPNAILVIDDMKVPHQTQFPYDNYGGDKVCDVEHIAPVIGHLCSTCIIPVYSAREVAPYTSLSGYGIFALQQDAFLASLLENPELALDFSIYSFADLELKSNTSKSIKIIGLVAAKNEAALIEFSLRALAPYVDSIVLFDDNSSDETVAIAKKLRKQCKIESILEKTTWDYNETFYRQALLDEGRRLGGTHFICLDADEAFTSNFLQNDELRKTISKMEPGDKLIFQWLQLWRSTLKVRRDSSIWTNNSKIFAFADDGVSNYHAQEFHLLRNPQGLTGKNLAIQSNEMGVMHFQFVNWENLLIKQAWYRCLELVKDETKSVAEINERYAPSKDETALGLVDVPREWFSSYPFFSPCYFTQLETWRSKQVISWFDEKGLDFFKDLDIWDVDWHSHRKRLAKTNQIKPIDPYNLMKAPLTEAEKHVIQLVEPLQGWFTDSEKLALFRMTKAQPENGKILEIGSFMGRSTNAIAHASIHTNREIYALDVWLDFGEDLDDRAQSENGIHILNTFLRNTQWFIDKLRVLKGSTTQYKYVLSNLQFDLIFVDAAHDYFNVCNDVKIALTAIKPNGWMIGHDYHNMGGEEVIKAVHDTLFDRDEIKIKGVFEGTTVWFAQIPEGFIV